MFFSFSLFLCTRVCGAPLLKKKTSTAKPAATAPAAHPPIPPIARTAKTGKQLENPSSASTTTDPSADTTHISDCGVLLPLCCAQLRAVCESSTRHTLQKKKHECTYPLCLSRGLRVSCPFRVCIIVFRARCAFGIILCIAVETRLHRPRGSHRAAAAAPASGNHKSDTGLCFAPTF